MADNYLERRMADYRSGRLATTRIPRPDTRRNALVADGLSPRGEARVRSLCASGQWRVAFCGNDYRRGSLLAQATGSRFYPVDGSDREQLDTVIADIEKRWGTIHALE